MPPSPMSEKQRDYILALHVRVSEETGEAAAEAFFATEPTSIEAGREIERLLELTPPTYKQRAYVTDLYRQVYGPVNGVHAAAEFLDLAPSAAAVGREIELLQMRKQEAFVPPPTTTELERRAADRIETAAVRLRDEDPLLSRLLYAIGCNPAEVPQSVLVAALDLAEQRDSAREAESSV